MKKTTRADETSGKGIVKGYLTKLWPGLDALEEPYWHDILGELYRNGPKSKNDLEDLDHTENLKEIGYIEKQGDEFAISPDGLTAYNEFRNQRLKFAAINVTGIVSVIVGAVGGFGSFIVGKQLPFTHAAASACGLAVILIFCAYVINKTLDTARQ